jgi:hypothetical protein
MTPASWRSSRAYPRTTAWCAFTVVLAVAVDIIK